MKKLLNLLLNLLKNGSVVVVLVLGGTTMYLKYDEETKHDLLNAIEEANDEYKIDKSEEYILAQDFDDALHYLYKKARYKVKIEIDGGYAYLQPQEVLYIQAASNSDDGKITITTLRQKKIYPHLNLSRLHELFNQPPKDTFFKTKSAIINCNYVQGLVKKQLKNADYDNNIQYNYQYYVIMGDGGEIPISKEKYRQLKNLMDSFI